MKSLLDNKKLTPYEAMAFQDTSMKFSDQVPLLQHLGLSNYEAKAYVSLVYNGTSTARELSGKCGIPRTKIYLTLKKLMERNLIFELPETPRKFAARSPADTLQEHLLTFRENISSRVISLIKSKEFVSRLENRYQNYTHQPLKENVWIIQGNSKIFNKLGEILIHAKRDVVFVVSGDIFLLCYKKIRKSLDKLIDSGVNVRIDTSITSRNKNLIKELNYVCTVQDTDINYPFVFISVDNREFLLADLASLDSDQNLGMLCQHPNIGHLISLLLSIKTDSVSHTAIKFDKN